MKHEEFDITTATPVTKFAALGIRLPSFRKTADHNYKAKDVVLPKALVNDDFLCGF